jgi:flagellar biosynthesis protein FlhB
MDENRPLIDSDLFLKYNYPETKDMCKQFLTLVSGILVLSLTFSEKIVDFKNAAAISKWMIISSWISLLLAIIFCGLGLLFITIAAGDAVFIKRKYFQIAQRSYKMIITAGAFFIFGLILLIGTGIISVAK